ncbi:MAG: site-2 protease family protein [Anaerolineales bacterium]|nr:site-2 protease family protein [Anaerolineales bacterium]
METNEQYIQSLDEIRKQVNQVFKVARPLIGNSEQGYLAKYYGELLLDSESAYDQLAAALRPYEVTPFFRIEEDQQVVIVRAGVVNPTPSNPRLNLILFIITLFSVIYAGALYSYDGPLPENAFQQLLAPLAQIWTGWPFAVSLLAILLAHEFGHYLMARYHKTEVTLPYFVPFPFNPLGTMGAVILWKEPPKNKKILLDVGIAGPLAGLVVAIPVLLLGLWLSPVQQLPTADNIGLGFSLEGNSILYLAAKYIIHGQLLPAPVSYGDVNPVVYWARYVLTGQPVPFGGMDVFMHPVAWAGWAGLLVTALNLIPAGQLDGGHVVNVLFGERARTFLPVVLIVLGGLGFIWPGWWLWVFLLLLLGRAFAEPLDMITPLDNRRKAVAIFGVIVFVLVFIPIPLLLITP